MTKIGIVEDNETVREMLHEWIDAEQDCQCVCVCSSAEQAVIEIPKHKPDLVLMDYHLADMDGVQLIEILRRHPSFVKTPIVVASGMNVEKESKAAGATEFLIKPFDPGYLPKLFHKLISGN